MTNFHPATQFQSWRCNKIFMTCAILQIFLSVLSKFVVVLLAWHNSLSLEHELQQMQMLRLALQGLLPTLERPGGSTSDASDNRALLVFSESTTRSRAWVCRFFSKGGDGMMGASSEKTRQHDGQIQAISRAQVPHVTGSSSLKRTGFRQG